MTHLEFVEALFKCGYCRGSDRDAVEFEAISEFDGRVRPLFIKGGHATLEGQRIGVYHKFERETRSAVAQEFGMWHTPSTNREMVEELRREIVRRAEAMRKMMTAYEYFYENMEDGE